MLYLLVCFGRWLKKRKAAKLVRVDQDLARRVGQLEDRASVLEQNLAGRLAQLSHVRFPDPDSLQSGMVLIWNGTAWVGHPTQIVNQPIVRKSRGKGRKREVVIDRPPTAWDRIQEDDDDGTDKA